ELDGSPAVQDRPECQMTASLAHVPIFCLEVQEVVRKPAPLGCIIARDVAAVVEVLRGELRKVVLDDSIALDPNEAGRRFVKINSVVQHDISEDLDPVRRGSRCHCPKLGLAAERALYLREINRLVAAPPPPHPLVALLRRRDMDMAVTQPSQHRDYLPDIGSPSGRAGYGKAARPDRESESRMAELFDRDRLGRAAVNARGAAMATGSFVKVARCRRAIPNTTQCAPGR